MMSSDFYFRDKIPVVVLGAAGNMGQKIVQALAHHPWFEIAALCDDSCGLTGQPYGHVISNHSLPESIQNSLIVPSKAPFPASIIFSFLQHSREARAQEKIWAEAGYFVISSYYQDEVHIPLIVAEVNSEQLTILLKEKGRGGGIAHPNSIACGVSLALKPIMEKYGLEAVQVMLFPFSKEEDDEFSSEQMNREIEKQLLVILGHIEGCTVQKASFGLSVKGTQKLNKNKQIVSVSVKLKKQCEAEELIQVWRHFKSESQRLPLPSAPFHPLYYLTDAQEGLADKGMAVYIEHLSSGHGFDYTFDLSFSHTIRGIIGSMLLNAELLVAQGYIFW